MVWIVSRRHQDHVCRSHVCGPTLCGVTLRSNQRIGTCQGGAAAAFIHQQLRIKDGTLRQGGRYVGRTVCGSLVGKPIAKECKGKWAKWNICRISLIETRRVNGCVGRCNG
jgi:hypothetical protein